MLKEEHYYHPDVIRKLSNMSHEMNGFNSPRTSPESHYLSPTGSEQQIMENASEYPTTPELEEVNNSFQKNQSLQFVSPSLFS